MRVTHLHVYCRDLEPALTFMTDALKGTLIQKRDMMGCPGAEIQFEGMAVYLREVGRSWSDPDISAQICGYNHLGFFVEDLDQTLARVTAMPDVRIDGEPFVIKERQRRGAYVVGPGNLYVEFVEVLK